MAGDLAFRRLRDSVDGVRSGEEVMRVREALGLSQRAASELLGGGPNAFNKYENGKASVSVPMNHLLTLLENDPKRLRELASGVAAAPSAKVAATKRATTKAKTRVSRKPAAERRRVSSERRAG